MNRIKRFFAKSSPTAYFIFFLSFGIAFGGMYWFKQDHKISRNDLSDSLPFSFFIIEFGSDFEVGDFVRFEYQSDDQRFYKNGMPMVKMLVAGPGDEVTFEGQSFFINQVYYGEAKKFSKSGKPLTKNVSKTLGEDEYFVYAPHPDSFDSRYISTGYISKSQIKGKSIWEYKICDCITKFFR